MTSIVITGAHGFIGTNIVERFLTLSPQEFGYSTKNVPSFSNFGEGYEIGFNIITSDLESTLTRFQARRFLGSSRVRFAPYHDLPKYLRTLKEPPKFIIHNGACSSTTETNPEIFKDQNLNSSIELWKYACEFQIPFLYASSASVYGDGLQGFSDDKKAMAKFKPMNLYAQSKHDFDQYALASDKKPPAWVGLRYFNVYGPYESHKAGQASMVYHGYHQAVQTQKIRLFKSFDPNYKDGEQLRDFIFADDIVDVTEKICKKIAMNDFRIEDQGLFLNLGVGTPRSWNDLALSIFKSLDLKPSIEYFDMPESLRKQYQNYTCADLTNFQKLKLDHKFVELEDGVYTYITRYLSRGL